MSKLFVLVLLVVCSAVAAGAQFGGRDGDVVLYMFTAKGSSAIQAVPDSTTNTKTGFIIEDPKNVPIEPFGPDFPAESRRKMHAEDGDVFDEIIQVEGDRSPHQQVLDVVKVFLIKGILRLLPLNEEGIDTTAGLYVPFPKSVDFGPTQTMFEGHYLLWTPSPLFPAAAKRDPLFHSPVVPPQYHSGADYLLAIGTFDGIVRWLAMNTQYPGAGWKQGIDIKWLDNDTDLHTTARLIRLRPGRVTPFFKIEANTHLWVLQGKVTITPAAGTPTVMQKDIYAFVPPGYAIRLANPADYKGPLNETVSPERTRAVAEP